MARNYRLQGQLRLVVAIFVIYIVLSVDGGQTVSKPKETPKQQGRSTAPKAEKVESAKPKGKPVEVKGRSGATHANPPPTKPTNTTSPKTAATNSPTEVKATPTKPLGRAAKEEIKPITLPTLAKDAESSSVAPTENEEESPGLEVERPIIDINATAPVKCDPREYVQRGYCQKYFTCNRKMRQEVKRGCTDGLFWNPNFNTIHGGVCDYLRNIENETLYEYKKDPTCILDIAYFRAFGDCSPKYYYNHPIRTEGEEREEICPRGLVWSRHKESCELCHLVKNAEGQPCCNTEAEDDY